MSGVHNEVSAGADLVVQAGDVRGGIHVHGTRRPGMPVPRLLPPDVTYFTGREVELGWLDAVLDGPVPPAMVISAIAGAAGIGKTSLAVRWAHRVRDHFPDGQLYVNLRGYDPGQPVTPEQALDCLLRALGVPGEGIPHGLDAMVGCYRSLLADRRMLVVLDNAAAAAQIRPLLPASPTCLVLVTSRSRLSGLVARDGAQRITLDLLSADEASTLLRAIVGTSRANAEPEAIADLANRCAYLPLALRIAAERVTIYPDRPIADLVTDLSRERNRLTVLATGDDESAAMSTVLSWSYRRLTPEAAGAFRLLGLHPGPDISVPAAAAMAGTAPTDVRPMLDMLASVHLLEQTGPDRFTFHDLVRAYAAECAATDSTERERANAVERVLEWYLHTAHAALRVLNRLISRYYRPIDAPRFDCQPLAFASHDQALRWYDTELANLMAAIGRAATGCRPDIAWQLPVTMTFYCHLHSHWDDLRGALQVGLAAAQQIHDWRGEYWVCADLCETHLEHGRFNDALAAAERALAIACDTNYQYGQGYALQLRGYSLCALRRFDDAIDQLRQALTICRAIDDRRGHGHALAMIGEALAGKQKSDDALTHAQQGLDILRTIRRPCEEAYALRTLAHIYLGLHRSEDAISYFQQAVTRLRELDYRRRTATTLQELGDAQHDAGQPHQAHESWHAALAILDDLNSPQAAQLRTRLDAGGSVAAAARIKPSEAMRSLGVVQDGDPILRRVARQFDLPAEAEDARRVVSALGSAAERIAQVHTFGKGMGIAAPQIGIDRAAAIVRTPDGEMITLFNPRVVETGTERDEQYEGCLSFFDVRGKVPRPLVIQVEHTTISGEHKITLFERGVARLVAHEVDHLHGRLYTDHMAQDVQPIPVEQYRGTGTSWQY